MSPGELAAEPDLLALQGIKPCLQLPHGGVGGGLIPVVAIVIVAFRAL